MGINTNTTIKEEGLGLDLLVASIVGFLIILISMARTNTYTREYEYAVLSVPLAFFIAHSLYESRFNGIKTSFDNGNYNLWSPFGMRVIPIIALFITCMFIWGQDEKNYTKLNSYIDVNNDKTLEEKLMSSPGYWVPKVFAIDFVMLILFGAIVANIYFDNSRTNMFYNNYKDYIQYVLIGGSIAMLFCTTKLSLPAIDKIINEDSTDG